MHSTDSRPSLTVDVSGSKNSVPPSSYHIRPGTEDAYSQSTISIFRSSLMEIHIHSPSVRTVEGPDYSSRSLPIFGDHDKIAGAVHLDPKLANTPGRLIISIEGTFVYMSPKSADDAEHTRGSVVHSPRHIFFNPSIVHSCGEDGSPRSASSIREAFANSMRPRRMDRRPSLQDVSTSQRKVLPFTFEIPPPTRPGEEMPPTFSSALVMETEARGRAGVERAEVEYKIIALWEGTDSTEPARLEAPILFQPDTDFQSLDGLSLEPETWLEVPLRSDRPIPFKCAITLPVPSTFPRSASIPYFVVFTTRPRDPGLAREITVDATVAVSFLRQITVKPTRPSPPPTAHASTTSFSSTSTSDDSDTSSNATRRLLRRVAKSSQKLSSSTPAESLRKRHQSQSSRDKPLPELPPHPGIMEIRTLHTDMSIGFPKRPRSRTDPNHAHPSLDEHKSLPDGLYKGRMQLNRAMLPSIDWAGLSVKYFLEVSVLFNQDEMRARIPVRIF